MAVLPRGQAAPVLEPCRASFRCQRPPRGARLGRPPNRRPGVAAPADHAVAHRSSTAAERAQIRAYWTAERMAAAVPADLHLDARRGPRTAPEPAPQAKQSKPTGGAAVPGATWTGQGLVARTTGKVLFTKSGTNYVCSGSVVDAANDSTVLTAGDLSLRCKR